MSIYKLIIKDNGSFMTPLAEEMWISSLISTCIIFLKIIYSPRYLLLLYLLTFKIPLREICFFPLCNDTASNQFRLVDAENWHILVTIALSVGR